MKTITISRAKWLRGNNSKVNYLWCNDRQAGCCLGHVIHQTSRCSWKKIEGLMQPEEFFQQDSILTNSDTYNDLTNPVISDNQFARDAMEINDNSLITEKEREKQLKNLFKKHKIKLVFKD